VGRLRLGVGGALSAADARWLRRQGGGVAAAQTQEMPGVWPISPRARGTAVDDGRHPSGSSATALYASASATS
jgi:hypothetical protein